MRFLCLAFRAVGCLSTRLVLLTLILALGGIGCTHIVRRSLVTPDHMSTLDSASPYLKVHMHSGTVYVLKSWSVDDSAGAVNGTGSLLNPARDTVRSGEFTLSVDSVALFETNVVHVSPAIAAMAVMTGVSVAMTMYCISNPKACFGSCPTFYTRDTGTDLLQAEGFSSSVAPSLERTDVDALYRSHAVSRDYHIVMKNEALETHVVRYVHLLAAPRPENGRVARDTDGRFREFTAFHPPLTCTGPEGDISESVRSFDGRERSSTADSADLATRERIELTFDTSGLAAPALVVGARQSLLSTYLFYQLLACLGRSAGDFYTALERGEPMAHELSGSIGHLLGAIDVYGYTPRGEPVPIATIGETGPLGTDLWAVRIPDSLRSTGRITLEMTRGGWRLNYLSIASMGREITPLRFLPFQVSHNGPAPSACRVLGDSIAGLVTLPGDEYDIVFRLPEDFDRYELFLESRGYYLEWMRQEWLGEENPARAIAMLTNPREALVAMAADYKELEPEIEETFWNSKYER